MVEKKSPRAIDELIAEVQEIRDLLVKIERRTMYLRPDGIFQSAGKQLASGILRGLGMLIAGILFFVFFGFIAQRFLSSDYVKTFIGEQIQSAVNGAIEKQMDSLPFR